MNLNKNQSKLTIIWQMKKKKRKKHAKKRRQGNKAKNDVLEKKHWHCLIELDTEFGDINQIEKRNQKNSKRKMYKLNCKYKIYFFKFFVN